ncbi:P-loop containing nucleoside triphosphate hydrolase protein [Mycena leptocephala]|nr:P-loop containing nucleoside triphosphate hydrolase protein [Mycena leptocephala]
MAITTQSLLKNMQTVKQNKNECGQLMAQTYELLNAILIVHIKSDMGGELPPSMLTHIGKFTETLYTIHTFVEAQQKGSKVKKFFHQGKISTLLNNCKAGLQQGFEFFQACVAILTVWPRDSTSATFLGITLSRLVSLEPILHNVLESLAVVENASVVIDRIQEFAELLPEEKTVFNEMPMNDPSTWPSVGSLTFADFSMKYRGDLPLALKNLSFDLQGGLKIGICGRTGSGKSSTCDHPPEPASRIYGDDKLDHLVVDEESFLKGQRQLLCLARALLGKKKIIVFDESTSRRMQGLTVLAIAHRISTTVNYDKILVLENGTIAEFDAPAALLPNPESPFARLAATQGIYHLDLVPNAAAAKELGEGAVMVVTEDLVDL